MDTIDPATGEKLPADAIVRVLFIAPKAHVYNIPPMASTKGHTAATWTEDPQRHISTCRVRVLETAIPSSDDDQGQDKVKTDIVLEDAASGHQLFAAAPYTSPAAVEPAIDSSRFFALRVQDPSGGRKATLGLGFEERSEAFDFGVALQDAQKALGLLPPSAAAAGGAAAQAKQKREDEAAAKRDLSLKEGETITINLGGKFGRRRPQQQQPPSSDGSVSLSAFSLPPPPSSSAAASASAPRVGNSLIPPPPGASSQKTAQDLGFDDGENGEFA